MLPMNKDSLASFFSSSLCPSSSCFTHWTGLVVRLCCISRPWGKHPTGRPSIVKHDAGCIFILFKMPVIGLGEFSSVPSLLGVSLENGHWMSSSAFSASARQSCVSSWACWRNGESHSMSFECWASLEFRGRTLAYDTPALSTYCQWLFVFFLSSKGFNIYMYYWSKWYVET